MAEAIAAGSAGGTARQPASSLKISGWQANFPSDGSQAVCKSVTQAMAVQGNVLADAPWNIKEHPAFAIQDIDRQNGMCLLRLDV